MKSLDVATIQTPETQEAETGPLQDSPEVAEIDTEQLEQHAEAVKTHIDQERGEILSKTDTRLEASASSMNVSPGTLDSAKQEFGLAAKLQEVQSEADQIASEAKQEIETITMVKKDSYDSPQDDPVIKAVEENIIRITNRRIQQIQKGEWGGLMQEETSGSRYGQGWDRANMLTTLQQWNAFIDSYPEKAEAYKDFEPVKDALNRKKRRLLDEAAEKARKDLREKEPEKLEDEPAFKNFLANGETGLNARVWQGVSREKSLTGIEYEQKAKIIREQMMAEFLRENPTFAQKYGIKIEGEESYLAQATDSVESNSTTESRLDETSTKENLQTNYEDWSLQDFLEFSEAAENHTGSVETTTIMEGVENHKVAVDFQPEKVSVSFGTLNAELMQKNIELALKKNYDIDATFRKQGESSYVLEPFKGVRLEIQKINGQPSKIKMELDTKYFDSINDLEILGLSKLLKNDNVPDYIDYETITEIIREGKLNLANGKEIPIKLVENRNEIGKGLPPSAPGTTRIYKAVSLSLAFKFARYGVFSSANTPNVSEQYNTGEAGFALSGYADKYGDKKYSALIVMDVPPDEYEYMGGMNESYGVAAKEYKGNRKRIERQLPTFARDPKVRHIPPQRIKEIILVEI